MTCSTFAVVPRGHEHARRWQALMRRGLKRLGLHEVRASAADMLVVWSWRQQSVIRPHMARQGRVLVMEAGYMGDRLGWCSLGFDGLNGRAVVPSIDDGGKRWETYFAHLMRGRRDGGDYVLLCGQMRGDMAVANIDIDGWYAEAAAAAARHGLPVVFRPHPGEHADARPGVVPGCETRTGALADALSGAAWVLTWNSNSGVDAVLAGVPTVACDLGSMVWDLSAHDPALRPGRPSRHAWARQMAFRQWLPDEVENGSAWEVMATCLNG